MDFNTFAIDNDMYATFVAQYDFSFLQQFPEVYSHFSKWGIGEQITSSGQYDHESGQLIAEWSTSAKNAVNDVAYSLLVQIADDYAEFVKAQASVNV